MDDKEFLSLDLEGAREYLLAYMTSAKRYEQDIAALEAEVGLWRGRITLAEKAGKPELAEAANKRAEELEAKRASLEEERQELLGQTRRLRERLPYLKARERSVDPDRLLAELDLMTGNILGAEPESKNTEAEIAKVEAQSSVDAALAELKRKL